MLPSAMVRTRESELFAMVSPPSQFSESTVNFSEADRCGLGSGRTAQPGVGLPDPCTVAGSVPSGIISIA
ncbi:hypothetical protein JCM18916_2206 [Cutibacterium acnes JCM 18916]|nr:hypothetical protein JCM18916_2206 [Cutibacterium acnes JCM 18916]